MKERFVYRIEKAEISRGKMKFEIISRRPEYPLGEGETVKAEVGKRLFGILRKYPRSD